MKQNPELIVASPPLLRNGETAHCLMFDVYIACLPAVIASVLVFGPRTLWVILLGILAGKLAEIGFQILFKAYRFQFSPFFYNTLTSDEVTVVDGSAVVTGLLLALTLPPGVPWWIPVAGSSVGLVLGKHVFGGLGHNIFNPALVGRAFLLAAWPGHMTTWSAPRSWQVAADAVTTATPLAALKLSGSQASFADLFLGTVAGSLGETSALAILVGAAYLFYKRTITWHIPCSYLGTVLLAALLLGQDPLFHLLAGSLLLGAFFMATDVVTSPITKPGRLVFGCMAGLLTILIRRYGGYPEGVCYAILIMNSLTPLIDKYTARAYRAGEVSIPGINRILNQK